MIIQSEGRSRSTRTQEEIDLQIAEELKSATPEEKAAIEEILRDIAAGKVSPDELYQQMLELEYHTEPVNIETFCKSPYYLGETCSDIYPQLLEDLKELFGGNYRECLWTGALGVGKSFTSSIIILYSIYEISCMRDPHRSFGLAPGTDISFVVFSVTEDLAIKVIFENIATKVASSPYFQEQYPPDILKKEIRFPGNVRVAPKASNDTSALGMNVISAVIDESNFLNRSKSRKKIDPRFGGADKAEVIYNTIKRRMITRYQQRGKLPGMFVIASSKQSVNDFTERMIRQAKTDKDSGIFVRDYAIWDIKSTSYTPGRFHVLCGTDQVPSRILEPGEAATLKADPNFPDAAVIISVPEDLRGVFVKDLDGAIKDLAGISITSTSPFFRQRKKIMECVDEGRRHPFTTESYTIFDPRAAFVWSDLVQGTGRQRQGGMRPIHFPGALRHIHFDLSEKKDATGLSVGCIPAWAEVERLAPDGRVYAEWSPRVFADFTLQVFAAQGGEIDYGCLIALVDELISHGFPIASVSADQHNSFQLLQSLAQRGLTTEVISVDKTTVPYETLKQAIYEDRMRYYPYPPLLKELRELEFDYGANKIDHLPQGSKDVADSLAGMTYALIKNNLHRPVMPLRGNGNASPSQTMWGDAADLISPMQQQPPPRAPAATGWSSPNSQQPPVGNPLLAPRAPNQNQFRLSSIMFNRDDSDEF